MNALPARAPAPVAAAGSGRPARTVSILPIAAALALIGAGLMPRPPEPSVAAPVPALPAVARAPRVPLIESAPARPPEELVPLRLRAPAPVEPPRAAARQSLPVYIDVGPRISEDFPRADEVVSACVFGTPLDRYPVLGDSIEVIVDGKALRLPYEPSRAYPGAKKVVVRVPGMFEPHTIVFKPIYDLGPDGSAPVAIVSRTDGLFGHSSWYESEVDRLEASGAAGRLRVK